MPILVYMFFWPVFNSNENDAKFWKARLRQVQHQLHVVNKQTPRKADGEEESLWWSKTQKCIPQHCAVEFSDINSSDILGEEQE